MFLEIRTLPTVDQRVETGPIQFGDDWPGTFIRGDDSANFAHHLRTFLSEAESVSEMSHLWLQITVLRGLLGTLSSSNLNARRPSQETGTARLERIDQLMDAKPGTPEGAELDLLADEQVRSEADWLSRPAGGGVAEQPAPVGAASVAPQPTCSKCGAVVRVLEVETNGWLRLESHICRATANVEYP